MPSPNIMSWTVLPFIFVAKAWTDSDFKTDLLANPNDVIKSKAFDAPNTYNFIINEDVGTTRYLTLPYYDPQFTEWSKEELIKRTTSEVWGDISMQYFLPPQVISKAFTDGTYKTNLLASPNAELSSSGYSAPGGVTFVINENDAVDHYLTLPKQPLDWMGLDYNTIVERLFFNGSQLGDIFYYI